MLSRFFVDRPVFAWVIAIAIMLAGVAAIITLPVEQYPDIAPPSINIRANYPGASADTVESSVTQVIEQQLTGIDGLLYFSSTSTASGAATVTVTLAKGTDPDIAQVQVQNKVQQALPRLPQPVQQQGLVVTKSNADFLMVISIYDETDRSTSRDVSDFLVSTLQDAIGRLPGVGDVNVFGAPYAMRIWLDPFKLAALQLMPSDVIAAVESRNAQVAAGQIGAQPSLPGQQLTAAVTSRSRLTSVPEFQELLVKTRSDGSQVRLGDVARVELGSENYTTTSRLNGHPGTGIAVQLAPGADALRTAELVKQEIERLSPSFPPGYRYAYPNDSTAFIRLSIREVVKTLLEAIVLVVIVMFVFLHNLRATLIPAVAVPVVLLGTFGVLAAFGFTINTLTLFGLVLSIGLLVDDAIVVVENVERVMRDNPGLPAREATLRSMDEVQSALIAIALVLSAVFLPMAFFGGSVGEIYRQFSITIIASMLLSVLVALVLSPALAAILLRPPVGQADGTDGAGTGVSRYLHRIGERFDAGFARLTTRYRDAVAALLGRPALAAAGYLAVCGLLAVVFLRLPTGFLPAEDQGIAQMQFTLPPGATLERTLAAAREIERYFLEEEAANLGVIYTVIGQGQGGAGQNAGRGFFSLAPWDARNNPQASAQAITRRATATLARLRDVDFRALNPPPVRGLGQSSGFTMQLLDTGGLGRDSFAARLAQLLRAAQDDPVLSGVRQSALVDNPTLSVDVDQAKAAALGIAQRDIDATLSTAWGGSYVNDFVDRGRIKRVYVQGDAAYRSRPEDIANWFVRSANGEMAPLSAVTQTRWTRAPVTLSRFNGLRAYEIQGDAAVGHSSGEAMARIAALTRNLPGTSYAWSGLSYQEQLSGGQAPWLYALSLLMVFLCLAALYESWSVPVAVMLTVPLGLVGAAVAVALRGLENDIYFQVGLLTTMGLAAKNAILIIEFAEQALKGGSTLVDAALTAAARRLRPIVMTSLAFLVGVLPLALSTGAGAQSRIAIGTAVIGGMITATVLAVFLVPLAFILVVWSVQTARGRRDAPAREPDLASGTSAPG